jgi:hypothetical protein
VPERAHTQQKIKGFVYHLTDERILERLETEGTFTDVLGYGQAGDRQLALLCLEEGVVSALAVMVRKRLALEGMRRRWLTNRAFVEMIGRGLIGSRAADTAAITEQIKAALGDRRAITLAVGGAARYRE